MFVNEVVVIEEVKEVESVLIKNVKLKWKCIICDE